MIQLNLLPDVKLQFIKAERMRRLIFSISALVAIAAVGLLVMLYSINLLQKKHIDDLSADIKDNSETLKKKPQINRVLTVQNQLTSLSKLHTDKPAVARVFEYLNQTTPTQINITTLDIDFTTSTITITGGADSLRDVNRYVDTLKFTAYTATPNDPAIPAADRAQGKTAGKAFGNVVLSAFGLDSQNAAAGSKPASYTIGLNYDPAIFNLGQDVKLAVPDKTTTRSSVNPSELFQNVPQTAPAAGTTTTGTGAN